MDEDSNSSTLIYQNISAAQTEENPELTAGSVEQPEEPAASDQKAKTAANSRQLLMCLGTLCVLLAAGLIILWVILIFKMKQQEATISDFTAKNKKLRDENQNLTGLIPQLNNENNKLMNETQELRTERDDLNWTLQVILTFDSFPVKDVCPNKKCQPCPNSWVLFRNSCYLFYKKPAPWKDWNQSQQFCQDKSSDLVVINDLQEQEFVSNNSEPYYDNAHGYWLGLRNINNIWVWVDGHNDTLGYWVTPKISNSGSYVLLMPLGPYKEPYFPMRILTQTWKTSDSGFKLRFICELRALIKDI